MNFGKKLVIGAFASGVAAAVGEYHLYKKFEHAPNPMQEILRWPLNDVWSRLDALTEEYERLIQIKTQPLHGRIRTTEGLERVISASSSHRSGYCIQEDTHTFITFENEQKLVYTGDFFAREGDSVSVQVVSTDDVAKVVSFVKRVELFIRENPYWYSATIGYGNALEKTPHVAHSINSIPSTKLRHLNGIIETYEILESK